MTLSCDQVFERLSEFVDGELSAADRAAVVDHLAECRHCERFGAQFAATLQTVRVQLQQSDTAPAAIRERLRVALTQVKR